MSRFARPALDENLPQSRLVTAEKRFLGASARLLDRLWGQFLKQLRRRGLHCCKYAKLVGLQIRKAQLKRVGGIEIALRPGPEHDLEGFLRTRREFKWIVVDRLDQGAIATAGKRLLAVLQFEQAQDLSRALSRLFTPASPIYERLASGRCFVRYTVIEDSARREAACAALQDWLAASVEAAAPQSGSPAAPDRETKRAEAPPPPLPAGF